MISGKSVTFLEESITYKALPMTKCRKYVWRREIQTSAGMEDKDRTRSSDDLTTEAKIEKLFRPRGSTETRA